MWTKFVSSCYVVEKKIEHQGGERSLGMELNDKERNRKDKKKAGERDGKDGGKREEPTGI